MTAAKIFKALSDPTRRQILQELKNGELQAGAIAERFDISAPSISRHLKLLEEAELVSARRDQNRILYRLEAENLASCLSDFMSAVCLTQVGMRRKIAKKGRAR